MYRIIGSDGKEYGPISSEVIRQWIAEGRLGPTTRVRVEAGGQWALLSQVPEFAGLLPSPAGPPPVPSTMHMSAPQPPARTSGMAIASLILGILGFFSCGITALIGLILGIVSLSSIKKSNGALTGSGLAIGGICVSGVFLLMIPLWVAMLLPAFAKAKEKAMSISCVNNVRQLALEARVYATDNGDRLPAAAKWSDAFSNGVPRQTVFTCPTQPGVRCSYAFNQALNGRKISEINPRTVLLFESNLGWNGAGGPGALAFHQHKENIRYQSSSTTTPRASEDAVVVAYVDGSVELVPRSRVSMLRWNP